MWIKEKIKQDFATKSILCRARLNSAKTIFAIVAFLFFVSFFFVWAWFYRDIFIRFLSILYILLLVSFDFLVFVYLANKFLEKFGIVFKIITIVFLLLFTLLMIWPVLYDWGFISFYNEYLN